MALSFGIPVCIVSDNDGNTKTEIESQLRKIERNTSLILSEKNLHVSYLSPKNDIEAELIHVVGMRQEIIEALINTETRGEVMLPIMKLKLEKSRRLVMMSF